MLPEVEVEEGNEKEIPNPVKVEKLPQTFKIPTANLNNPPLATRDNEYALLLKSMTKKISM